MGAASEARVIAPISSSHGPVSGVRHTGARRVHTSAHSQPKNAAARVASRLLIDCAGRRMSGSMRSKGATSISIATPANAVVLAPSERARTSGDSTAVEKNGNEAGAVLVRAVQDIRMKRGWMPNGVQEACQACLLHTSRSEPRRCGQMRNPLTADESSFQKPKPHAVDPVRVQGGRGRGREARAVRNHGRRGSAADASGLRSLLAGLDARVDGGRRRRLRDATASGPRGRTRAQSGRGAARGVVTRQVVDGGGGARRSRRGSGGRAFER